MISIFSTMRVRINIFGILCMIFLLPAISLAQDYQEEIQTQSQKLESLRREIEDFRNQLSTTKSKEQSLLERLGDIDKEVDYSQRLVNQIERTQREREQHIQRLNDRLDENSKQLKNLQNRLANRMVHMYKKGNYNDLELLLDSQSLNQAMYRYKYLRVINAADEKLMHSVKTTMQSIEDDQAQLRAEIRKQNLLLKEKKNEKNRLQRERRQRQQLLAHVQKDRKSLQESITERETAAKKLELLISQLEERKARMEREAKLAQRRALQGMSATTDPMKLKGKLPWPTHGKVVAKFGKYEHPRLKTVTENTGIDIAAKKGTDVIAVLDGLVTTITWIRGYGTTIIIDHGSGLYTVYTHVINTKVAINNYVNAGDVIAEVGDSGSLDGAKLHFEVWANRHIVNPEQWLAKL